MTTSSLQSAVKTSAPTAVVSNHLSPQPPCACGASAGFNGGCEGCNKQRLSLRRSTRNSDHEERTSSAVPPIVHEVLQSSGQSLDAETRAFMEPRFGHSFSEVQVHADSRAAASVKEVNALAYTVGRKIVFGEGQYRPREPGGQLLIAHELTHVLQQKNNSSIEPTELGPENDAHEREAAAVSLSILSEPQKRRAVSVGTDADAGVVQGGWPLIVAAGAGVVAGGIYALWAYNCLKPLELPMYRATFGDTGARAGGFRLWYYNQTRTPVPSNVWDGFGHCWIACESTKRCGSITAAIAGKSREFWREHIDSQPHDSYQQDTNNQNLGRSFGSTGADCTVSCQQAALPGGRLDRSAPVVTLWTPATDEYNAPAPPPPAPAAASPDAGVGPPDAGLRDAGTPLPGGLP